MKILCLHGYGTSGEIFKQQLHNLMQALGEEHDYVFIDGEHEVERSAMAEFIPGKTVAFFDGCWPEEVAPASELIAAVVEEEGPFDGVIGYSQGATIFMSYCLELPQDAPPPVKWGLFIGPNMISSSDQWYNEEEATSFMSKLLPKDKANFHGQLSQRVPRTPPEEFESWLHMPERDAEVGKAILSEAHLILLAREFFHVEETTAYEHKRDIVNPTPHDVPRFFHPVWSKERIQFPAVFALGRQDSQASKKLCAIARGLVPDDRKFLVEYDGIHEVPHKKLDVDNIARTIEKAAHLGHSLPGVF